MFKILTLNSISVRGLERLPRDRYEVASEIGHPDAVLLRSADMHEMEIPASVLAVARAGAGINNIPVATLSRRGVPVFNSPGANANAVKELVLGGIFLAARNICQAWKYVGELTGDDEAIEEAVEKDKKRFVGFELPGRTLGVVGLGALASYVCDFPSAAIKDHPRVVALPHLGASTGEAEDNCAVMAAETLRDFLENGNIRNSVNFPEAVLPKAGGCRIGIANDNVPNMVGQISTCLAAAELNIADLLNKSRGELAYTLIDTETQISADVLARIKAIPGVLAARLI
jgi:phosphoglycerate dehydrogenase-like enzyme